MGQEPRETWAVHSEISLQRIDSPSGSGSGSGMKRCWKRLWKLPVPPKVHNFWSRVMHNYIPCRSVLEGRHMECKPFCETRGQVETVFHDFFERRRLCQQRSRFSFGAARAFTRASWLMSERKMAAEGP